jgi:uncharacterized protein
MSAPSSCHRPLAAELELTELPQELQQPALSPQPVRTGAASLPGTPHLTSGIWEHSPGVSTDVEVEEVFVVVSGTGRIVLLDQPEEPVLELEVGTVVHLTEGARTRWEIDEPGLRKVYVMPAAPTASL